MAAHAALNLALFLLCAQQGRVDIEDKTAWGEYAQYHFGVALGNIVKD